LRFLRRSSQSESLGAQQSEAAGRRQAPSIRLAQHIDDRETSVMTKPPPDRWLAVGAALTGVGAVLGVGYWIYGMQASPHVSFWRLPGYIAIALLVLGSIALVVGLLGDGDEPPPVIQQRQRGGDNSVNIQSAGGIGRAREVGDDE
jgi:hypothetical protein